MNWTPARGIATIVLVLALALAGCAAVGAGGTEFDPMRDIQVTVVNDIQPPTSLTVRAVPQPGAPHLLGSVNPGGTRAFSFTPSGGTTAFRIVAVTTDGTDYISDQVHLNPGDRIEWQVSAGQMNGID